MAGSLADVLFLTHVAQIVSTWMVKATQVGTFNCNIVLSSEFSQMWEPVSTGLLFKRNIAQSVPLAVLKWGEHILICPQEVINPLFTEVLHLSQIFHQLVGL